MRSFVKDLTRGAYLWIAMGAVAMGAAHCAQGNADDLPGDAGKKGSTSTSTTGKTSAGTTGGATSSGLTGTTGIVSTAGGTQTTGGLTTSGTTTSGVTTSGTTTSGLTTGTTGGLSTTTGGVTSSTGLSTSTTGFTTGTTAAITTGTTGVTPVSCDGCKLKVYFKNGGTQANQINAEITIGANGNTGDIINLTLDHVTFRYWYSDSADMLVDCFYFEYTCPVVSSGKLAVPQPGADHYIEFSFPTLKSVYLVNTGDPSKDQIKIGMHHDGYTNLDSATDDYSYLPDTTATQDAHITAYIDGQLAWGTEPGGAAATSTGGGGTTGGASSDGGATGGATTGGTTGDATTGGAGSDGG